MCAEAVKVKIRSHNAFFAFFVCNLTQTQRMGFAGSLRSIHTSVNVCLYVCVCVKLQHCAYGMLRQTQRMGSIPIQMSNYKQKCKKKKRIV